jgi:hypothetical protein
MRVVVIAVVNAAGPAAGDIAGFVGRTLPMRDEPGLVARLRCDHVPIRRVMHAPHVELRPHDRSRIASAGQTERCGERHVTNPGRSARMRASGVVGGLSGERAWRRSGG